MTTARFTVTALALAAASAASAQSRDQIHIVGSSTVFPYTQVVAERFAKVTGAPAPIVESTGTGGGMQIFCQGLGEEYPDITNASRAMTFEEYELCQRNGVTSISEAEIGYDGLSIAMSNKDSFDWDLSLGEVYLALAAQVPVDGEWVDNPFTSWAEVNPRLPDQEILAYGPPSTSGTRDAFVELAMHVGCQQLDFVTEGGFDADWVEENCTAMRADGRFVETGEDDTVIVGKIEEDETAMGIFGFSFLYENRDTLKAVSIEGIAPSIETITLHTYPISRPLFFYVKNHHREAIPHLEAFLGEYMSDDALKPGGYLAEHGLVPIGEDRFMVDVQMSVLTGERMDVPD
ncbi:substrate-binding domain-containing protein [Amaricoccus macauensis]|uniref:substrate-binding domain-containing protein n=1 Tax=Amaricoccus macauensis TaxID=57001 RepID=UPI003C7B7328